jgi:hypothetical protein
VRGPLICSSRYFRQVLLLEIGESGQARLAAAEAAVGGIGLAHDVATRYAEGAGFGRVVDGAIDGEKLVPGFLELGAARAVLAGSRATLSALRAALGADSGRAP